MKKIFSDWAWEDYLYWQKNDKRTLKKVNELIKDIDRNHHEGLGKPEPLRHSLSGYWSRRINQEHRLVYRISEDAIYIAQVRYHY
ncbi:Txe/YoeB family addiction module toxin [Coraliomargarita sinensis]|uniref:Putative mRNA interferase YoeB n=1 Tax=Coraliomargarita sinensis TaxID=2174842 RepID=A0A317ZIR7_9BACT|nr:Txe/YoeB family addiction module toxin [Coraliomargarita sinensis]PXA03659.1 Txe/YoeB family addiction module toxin [Coraliomargarita sinensis]